MCGSDAYLSEVQADQPWSHWRLRELNGTTAFDCSGFSGRQAAYSSISPNGILTSRPFWTSNSLGTVKLASPDVSRGGNSSAASIAPLFWGGFVTLPQIPAASVGGPFGQSWTVEFWARTDVCKDNGNEGYYEPGGTAAQLLSLGDERAFPSGAAQTDGTLTVSRTCPCAAGAPSCACTSWNDTACGHTTTVTLAGPLGWNLSFKSPPLGLWAHVAITSRVSAPPANASGGSAYASVSQAYVNGIAVARANASGGQPPADVTRSTSAVGANANHNTYSVYTYVFLGGIAEVRAMWPWRERETRPESAI